MVAGEIIGCDADLRQEAAYLGRTIRWTDEGIELQSDVKHSHQLLKETGLTTCQAVTTPISASMEELDQGRPAMEPAAARRHRAGVARVVYMAQDRADLAVAACELAKSMASPLQGDERRLQRVARYVRGHMTYSQVYKWQDDTDYVRAVTDSDWATCPVTRRSNSGGMIFLGDHVIAQWCRVQPRVALSSAEAELYAGVRGISEMLGVVNLGKDLWGKSWGRLEHWVDASARRAIELRRGTGTIKHLSLKVLWIQEAIREHQIAVIRIGREKNVAHILASAAKARELDEMLGRLQIQLR